MSTVIDLHGKHLLKLADFSPEEIAYLDRPRGRAEGREARRAARSRSSSARRSR